MAQVTRKFHAAVQSKAREMADMEQPPKQAELSEGDITAYIVMALSRNGVRGRDVPRIMWRENGKVVAAASLEIV